MSSRHANRADISYMGKAAEETEVQRAANKQLMDEGRIIRSKELERRRREEENGCDNYKQDGSNKTSSNGGPSRYSSQRSSVELSSSASSSSRSMDARELRMQLLQLEEKFKGAMMANVQLDNDKQLLRYHCYFGILYEVDLLKDKLEDLTDSNACLQKSFLEKKRELAYERMQVAELNHRLDFARKQIEARDQLLIEHDLILLGGSDLDDAPPLPEDQKPLPDLDDEEASAKSRDVNEVKRVPNGFADSGRPKQEALPSMALISKSTADMLNNLGEPNLEAQIVRLFDIRKELTARVEKLENDLETERNQPGPVSRYESRTRYAQSQEAELKQDLHNLRSQAQEYKYKLQEALQRNTALESDVSSPALSHYGHPNNIGVFHLTISSSSRRSITYLRTPSIQLSNF
ncbi:Leucine rich repeat flightless interacting [Fasciolopsis buskii]|uniref:Leucine rich repeat flightless interacting n=1 Tax=Fasciolopsis buskii TaxID=27845 RepID=A0A8E0S4M0_9TREM|nr:Leucine rich repeat flightless interacting [Fasciolopsis buski]